MIKTIKEYIPSIKTCTRACRKLANSNHVMIGASGFLYLVTCKPRFWFTGAVYFLAMSLLSSFIIICNLRSIENVAFIKASRINNALHPHYETSTWILGLVFAVLAKTRIEKYCVLVLCFIALMSEFNKKLSALIFGKNGKRFKLSAKAQCIVLNLLKVALSFLVAIICCYFKKPVSNEST